MVEQNKADKAQLERDATDEDGKVAPGVPLTGEAGAEDNGADKAQLERDATDEDPVGKGQPVTGGLTDEERGDQSE